MSDKCPSGFKKTLKLDSEFYEILYGVNHKLKGKLTSKLICTFEKRPISS